MKILKRATLAIGLVALSTQLSDAFADDVVSIKSDQANLVFTAPGMTVDFKITLAGTFALTNAYGGSPSLLPQLRMIVNSDVAWASVYSLTQYKLGGLFDRTDVRFRYTVQPGDMAQPLRIFGSPISPYQFLWNGWEVRNTTTGSAAVWNFNPMLSQAGLGESYDIDLARAKITLRALAFDPVYTPSLLALQESGLGRVTSVSPIGTSAVEVVVWTRGTNVLQVGSSPSGTVQQVTLASGATAASFQLRGLSVGTADLYLQRARDYATNATLGVTNYVRWTVSVAQQAGPVANPIFTPPSGATDTNSLAITLACPTDGAVIRYTLDGSEPALETGHTQNPFVLWATTAVKARAFKEGKPDSETVTASYTVVPRDFSITDVKLLCRTNGGAYSPDRAQPLDTDWVGVEAHVVRPPPTVSNIQLYVSWYVGTNHWGSDKWPPSQTTTQPLYPVPGNELAYRSASGQDIPPQARNTAVQYRVWGTYWTDVSESVRQQTFENPSWYYPVDLNARYAAQGWSPYYFVYDAPPGTVWINEVNALDYVEDPATYERLHGFWDNAYIELAVPAWMDLEGWSVDLVKSYPDRTQTITLPAVLQPLEPGTNGYAFFVIADTDPASGSPSLPIVSFAHAGLNHDIPMVSPGGLRLKRPTGAYEQAIAYDWDPTPAGGSASYGSIWATNDPEHCFVYVGREDDGGSLARTGLSDSTNTWMFPQPWSPGAPNAGQQYPFDARTSEHVTDVFITSMLGRDLGTADGVRLHSRLIVRQGTSTNVTYAADAWYRLATVRTNGSECLPAEPETERYSLQLQNVRSHITVDVDFRVKQDLAEIEERPDILGWMLGFAEAPLAPTTSNGRPLSLEERYWLNANPTASNSFELAVTRFEIDAQTNIHVRVKMALNGEKRSALQGGAVLKLMARPSLSSSDAVLLAQYSLTEQSFGASNECDVSIPNPFAFVLADADPRALFFNWTVEPEDLRVGVRPLVTEP